MTPKNILCQFLFLSIWIFNPCVISVAVAQTQSTQSPKLIIFCVDSSPHCIRLLDVVGGHDFPRLREITKDTEIEYRWANPEFDRGSEVLAVTYGIKGYPTILLDNGRGDLKSYNGQQNLKAIFDFVRRGLL